MGAKVKDKKILIADDSLTVQKVIKLILANKGCILSFYNDGNDAYKAIPKERPDLVIADVDLKGLNGYELGYKLQKEFKIPLILIHSSFSDIDDEKYKKSAAVDKISKPFNEEVFINAINNVLEENIKEEGDDFFTVKDDIEELSVPDDEIGFEPEGDVDFVEDGLPTENLSDEEAEKLLEEFNLEEKEDGTIKFKEDDTAIKEEPSELWEDDIPIKEDLTKVEEITKETVRKMVKEILPDIVEKIVKEELKKIID